MLFKTAERSIIIFCFLFFAISISCQGCSGSGRPQAQSGIVQKRLPYKKVFDKWTKNGRMHRGFDLELIASATFKSREFRAAYVDEYARVYKLSESQKKKMIFDQDQAASDYNEFVIAAYVPREEENDFSKKESIWKIYLAVDEKDRALPVEIRKIYIKNAFLTYFFPCITPWKSVYIVRFPIKFPGTERNVIDKNFGNIKLGIAGVAGGVEFNWTVDKKNATGR